MIGTQDTVSLVGRKIIDIMESRQTSGQFHVPGFLGQLNLNDYFPGITVKAHQATPNSIVVEVELR